LSLGLSSPSSSPSSSSSSSGASSLYYVYGRIHGDLERDYNYFVLEPEFFSFGPGNFRDINQNRRSNILTYKPLTMKTSDVLFFYSLIQADGYNPLSIRSTYFDLTAEKAEMICGLATNSVRDRDILRGWLLGPIVPFELFHNIEAMNIHITVRLSLFFLVLSV
jgi:hypothetical protein